MKSLSEIIEDCKCNGRPEYEELFYSVLVLTTMLNLDHNNLSKVLLSKNEKSPLIKKMMVENSHDMYKTALNKSPKEYLGWRNDPENPEYQKFHAMANKLLDKAIKGELPNQKK